MANKKYKLTDGNYWATDGVYDFDQGKTQREVNGDLIGAIMSVENGMAIVINGKRTTTAATKGQFVFLTNSTISGKTDGAYIASKAIPANTDLDGTYLTAISKGALNSINDITGQIEFGTWQPTICDLNTFKRNTVTTGKYAIFGKFGIFMYSPPLNTYDDLSGITTMFTIQNLPYAGIVVGGIIGTGGTNTIDTLTHYIQGNVGGKVYFRPNIVSTQFTDATQVTLNFVIFYVLD